MSLTANVSHVTCEDCGHDIKMEPVPQEETEHARAFLGECANCGKPKKLYVCDQEGLQNYNPPDPEEPIDARTEDSSRSRRSK